ncbi:hypothetical protein [Maricaulis parjimensis]|uniref:hypothetical protein n=1 Tax=Maricaulis parjimensis TaxID=144023 RepID=UPI00193A2270|nr:hypothetical protein [Maricaulis parjimensis]
MKAVLNLVSLAALGALGAGIYFTQGQEPAGPAPDVTPDPVVMEDSVDEGAVADEGVDAPEVDAEAEPQAARYTVDGTQPGYFVPNVDIRFGNYLLTSIMVEPAYNGFEERVMLSLEDTSQVAGSNEYGDYYQGYPFQVDDWSVTPEGVMISASHAELGMLSFTASYDPAGYAAWTSGEDAVGELLIADVSLNDVTREGVSLAFWVGD